VAAAYITHSASVAMTTGITNDSAPKPPTARAIIDP
jgi:hypothetical protein